MRNILPLLLFIAAAACVMLLWPREVRPVKAAPPPGGASSTPPRQVAPESGGDAAVTAARRRVDAPADAKARADAAGRVVLRGRCVDPAGAPLAGVALKLHGWERNRQDLERHRREHGEVQWSDPELPPTGADGRFEVAFVPPPPYQFMLDLTAEGREPKRGRWSELGADTTRDLGDVVLHPGCLVRGRVLYTDGRPVRKRTQIILKRAAREPGDVTTRTYEMASTVAGGTFALQQPIAPGTWELSIPAETVRSPSPFVVPEGRTEWFVDIVVAAGVARIRGVVVAPDDTPLASVRVELSPPSAGRRWTVQTDEAGRFDVQKTAQDSGAAVTLTFARRGYEAGVLGPVAWGSEGHRVVLRPGASLSLLVTNAATGKPVEDYGVLASPAPGRWSGPTSGDRGIRDRGHHDGGRAVVAGLARGHYDLLVEPVDKELLPSRMYAVEVRDGTPELHVEVHPGVERDVVVQTAAGGPIAGTTLQLVQPLRGTVVDTETFVIELHGRSSSTTDKRALLVAAGATGADGRCTLRAPPTDGYVLRILGPGHQPRVVRGVAICAGNNPLQVEVAVGARITGTVGPQRLVDQLRAIPREPWEKLGLRLRRVLPGGAEESLPSDAMACFELDPAGRFVAAGIPPGAWEVVLGWRLSSKEPVGTLENLREGETREVTLALPQLVLAEVTGRVTHNGAALSGGVLTLRVDAPGRPQRLENVRLDAEGRYRALVVADEYDPVLQLPGRTSPASIPSATRVAPTPGQRLERDVDFRSHEHTVRVTGPDGEPRTGVRVRLRAPALGWQAWITSDADGKATVLAPPGTLELHVWPKRLMDIAARKNFMEEHRGDPEAWNRAALAVGAIDGTAGARTVKVELPATSGY